LACQAPEVYRVDAISSLIIRLIAEGKGNTQNLTHFLQQHFLSISDSMTTIMNTILINLVRFNTSGNGV
jgi:hypothetical protein